MEDLKSEVVEEDIRGVTLKIYRVRKGRIFKYSWTLDSISLNDEGSDYDSQKEAYETALASLEDYFNG